MNRLIEIATATPLKASWNPHPDATRLGEMWARWNENQRLAWAHGVNTRHLFAIASNPLPIRES